MECLSIALSKLKLILLSIDFEDALISDEGIRSFCQTLKNLTQLTSLSIVFGSELDNEVTTAGIKHLEEAFKGHKNYRGKVINSTGKFILAMEGS